MIRMEFLVLYCRVNIQLTYELVRMLDSSTKCPVLILENTGLEDSALADRPCPTSIQRIGNRVVKEKILQAMSVNSVSQSYNGVMAILIHA